jgi:hypothetical protein
MSSVERPDEVVHRLLGMMLASPTDIIDLSPGDLDLTLRITRRVNLLGWLAARLVDAEQLDRLPRLAVDQLAAALTSADARERLARWELNRIEWAIGDDKVTRIVALKGCAYLLLGLPNARGRSFADVDLLMTESDLEPVELKLMEKGWQGTKLSPYDQHYYRAWTHELPPMTHPEREVEIDLHHNILPRTARLKPSGDLLMQNSRPLADCRFRVLDDIDIVLHAMTHLMFDSNMEDALRDLVDIDILLRHFSAEDGEFIERLANRAMQLDLGRPAYYALRYSRRFLHTPVPASAGKILAPAVPVKIVLVLMDKAVPRSLYPPHPDSPSVFNGISRLALYVRSHWIRMPPLLLARPLAYKFYVQNVPRLRALWPITNRKSESVPD